MSALSNAFAAADAVRVKLEKESKLASNQATTPEEIAEGIAQKQRAQDTLDATVRLVNTTISALRKNTIPKPKVLAAVSSANDTPIDKVKQAMSSDGLKPGTQSLEDMAKATGPILDNFDDILRKPYLSNYNATLNTVPVVGIKDNKILYIETKQDITGTAGLKEVWSFFSDLPADATIKPDDKVFLFPYVGDFCLSIGRAVWRKAHLSDQDPARSSAVDNWPNLYVRDWVKVGDNVLPAADLISVTPFAVISADHQQMAFHLTCLHSDGTIGNLNDDTLKDNGNWETLRYTGDGTAPKWTKIAYWNGNIVAIDPDSNTWNISPTFSDGTYTAADKTKIDPVTEFTANDVGLIGVRADGYLWKRVVEAPKDPDSDSTLKWTRWIKVNGAAHLGFASPGVLLDLNLLTKTLRSRYIEVQTAVYPVVDKIRAFGITHGVYLKNVMKDAQDYQNATTEQQQQLAIKNAKAFVAHAKTWSLIVSRSIGGAKESVNLMTAQLHDVRVQLEKQLVILQDKLVGLQATLKTQQDALSKLTAAFWGAVAATLLSIVVAIAGVITANPVVLFAAGLLFVGGIVAMVALSVKIAELNRAIADTEGQIRDVNTAIAELSSIVKSFTDIDALYGTLNTFWGRMQSDASDIGTMDDATAIQIGAGILDDTSSIEASTEMTTNMTNACVTYIDVLNKQGIHLPVDNVSAKARVAVAAAPVSRSISPQEKAFHAAVNVAQSKLAAGDLPSYQAALKDVLVKDNISHAFMLLNSA